MVDIVKIRKDFLMNVAALNTMALFYIGMGVMAILVVLLVMWGNPPVPPKKE